MSLFLSTSRARLGVGQTWKHVGRLAQTGVFERSVLARGFASSCCPPPGSTGTTSTSVSMKSATDARGMHSQINNFLDEEEKIMGTMPELEDIMENNRKWVAKKNEEDPTFFQRIGKSQAPRYLYIGCSDARVAPKEIMGFSGDEVFVTRNIGNQVAPGDLNILSVMEFSLGVLKIPHVVVCGHYDCGAIRGALARPKDGGFGFLENWLRHVRDVARLHKDELAAIKDPEEKHRRLVQLNVKEQCFNVFKSAIVQRRRAESFKDKNSKYCLPRVHGVVFDVKDGSLTKVPLDFKQDLESYRPIYDLYQTSEPTDEIKPEFWEGRKN